MRNQAKPDSVCKAGAVLLEADFSLACPVKSPETAETGAATGSAQLHGELEWTEVTMGWNQNTSQAASLLPLKHDTS